MLWNKIIKGFMGSVRYTDSSQLNTYTNIVCTLGTYIIVLGVLPV